MRAAGGQWVLCSAVQCGADPFLNNRRDEARQVLARFIAKLFKLQVAAMRTRVDLFVTLTNKSLSP